MIILNLIYFIILINLISNVPSQSSAGDALGPSACDLYAVQQTACKIPDVPIESLPKNCSSFLYSFVGYDKGKIFDMRAEIQSIKGYLDKLIQTNIPVVIMFEYPNSKEWCAILQCNNTEVKTTEMNNLKSFLEQHKGIKGILLMNLFADGDPLSTCPDYSQNLKSYIDLMKKTFPDLSVGINLSGPLEMNNYKNPKHPWLDLNVIDPSVDFYVLSLVFLNSCSKEFLKSSQYPLTEGSNTVDKVRNFLEKVGANSSKIHYGFTVYADTIDPNAEFCTTFPTYFCLNANEAKTTLCADTLQSLYEKGAYAKQYGAGFVLASIDNDDYDCTCQCGMSYPGFNAMLSGYNGGPRPQPCALFDRT